MSREGINSRSQLRSVPPTNKSQARERDRITDTCMSLRLDKSLANTRAYAEVLKGDVTHAVAGAVYIREDELFYGKLVR